MPRKPIRRCECGCGAKPRDGALYLYGHNISQSEKEYLVEPGTGCWIWQGEVWRNPQTRPRKRVKGVGSVSAYRWYYEQYVRPIPEGLTIDHLCNTPMCVNPQHLEPCTLLVNQRRAGHMMLSPEQVFELRQWSDETNAQAAKRLGCSPETVRAARWNRTHKDVPYDPEVAQFLGIKDAVVTRSL